MPKKALVVLADGFEEIEAVTPIDLLRRAGLEVTVAGLDKTQLTGSHGIRVQADLTLAQYREAPDALLVPGGPGSEALGKSAELLAKIRELDAQQKVIAAICAAPAVVLAPSGVLQGKAATCFPGYEKRLTDGGAVFRPERVVSDGRIVTSRGAGTAMEFSLELIERLCGAETSQKIALQVLAAE